MKVATLKNRKRRGRFIGRKNEMQLTRIASRGRVI
jgi:hypothetical protein